jgi:hypothetical protein
MGAKDYACEKRVFRDNSPKLQLRGGGRELREEIVCAAISETTNMRTKPPANPIAADTMIGSQSPGGFS